MRVAVAYDDGNIFSRFGETKFFKLYELEGKSVVREVVVPAFGEGHEALAACLGDYGANVLICGGIGGSARVALGEAGILVFGGVIGKADVAVQAFLNGTLNASPEAGCGEACSGQCDGCGEGCPHASGCDTNSSSK